MQVPRPASSVSPSNILVSRCTWLLALLCSGLCAPSGAWSQEPEESGRPGTVRFGDYDWLFPEGAPRVEETEPGAQARVPSVPAAGSLERTLEDSRIDPSLGGRLHLDYRLTYQARFYKHRPYEFPFPDEVTPIDERFAAELKELHGYDEDQDIDQYLSIRTHNLFTPGRSSGLYQNFDTELSLRYFRDIDGTPPRTTAVSVFRKEEFQLRTLNAKLEMLQRHLELTLGRQYVESAEWVHIDGGKATVRGLGLFDRPVEIEAFAGRRVAFYRTIDRKEIYGGRISYLPTRDTRIEFANVYYIDNTFRADVFQRITPDWTAFVSYRQINLDPESVRFETTYQDASRGFELRAFYLGKLGERADDFDFDYTFSDRVSGDDADHDRRFNISDIKPFDDLGLELRQELTERCGAFAGGTVHHVRAGGERDAYNTDWYEVWAGLDVNHVPWEGLTGRLTLRYMDTDLPRRQLREPDDPLYLVDIVGDGEPDFLSLEFLLEQAFGQEIALGAHVNFRSYSYDSRFASLDNLDALALDGYFRYRFGPYTTCYLAVSYETDADYFSADFDELLGLKLQLQISW